MLPPFLRYTPIVERKGLLRNAKVTAHGVPQNPSIESACGDQTDDLGEDCVYAPVHRTPYVIVDLYHSLFTLRNVHCPASFVKASWTEWNLDCGDQDQVMRY